MRIGNGAAEQLQLDIYGELINSVGFFNKFGSPIHHDDWMNLTQVVEWVCDNWDQADEGIWEVRGGRQDFVYSRLMSWVALERALRIAMQRGLPGDIVRSAPASPATRRTCRRCQNGATTGNWANPTWWCRWRLLTRCRRRARMCIGISSFRFRWLKGDT